MKRFTVCISVILAIILASLLPIVAFASDGPGFYGAVHRTWIVPSPNNPGAEFGNVIAMDRDTLVVGARHDSVMRGVDPVYQAGAVYVYVHDGNAWNLQARLAAPDAEAYDLFGSTVDIYQDTIIVGAVGSDGIDENDNAAPDMGAVYVFTRNGDQWDQQTKIQPEDGIEDDNFGNAVAIVGERIVVGASAKDFGNIEDGGKVYSYYRVGSKWYQAQSVTAPQVTRSDFFGSSLDYDGQRLVVGAQAENSIGAAYIFYRTGSTWTEEAKIESESDKRGDNFGASVSIDGETIAVGAPYSDPDLGLGEITNAGAVYVFHKHANSWNQQSKLVYEDAVVFDHFGQSVKIDNTKLIVGATMQDYYTILRSGAAHVYERRGGEWELQSTILSGEPYMDGDFGASLALNDELIIIGEPGTHTLNRAGTVHIYSLEAGILPETGYTSKTAINPSSRQNQSFSHEGTLQLEIPDISLNAKIVGIPRQANTWNVDWLFNDLGHLAGTAYPTHIGNSVIAGHVNLPDGTAGPLANINQLQWGDQMTLSLDGIEFIYEVRNIYTANPGEVDILEKNDGYDWLTLITCASFNTKSETYTQRIIVEAVRVK